MKKTRILAGLLCILMVICTIPIMQVSAAGVSDTDLMTAIGAVMGYTEAVPATTTADWVAADMDFSNSFTQTSAMTADSGITYDANGINFPAGSAKTWKYTEQAPGKAYGGWSPLCVSLNYSFRFKLTEGGQLEHRAPRIWGTDNRGVIVTFTPESVSLLSGGSPVPDSTNYAPGTDWNDVLIRNIYLTGSANEVNNGGYQVWMKKASDTSFAHVGNLAATSYTYVGASFSPGPVWATDGITFTGSGANVKHLVSAKEKPEETEPTPDPDPEPEPTPEPTPGTLASAETVAASNRTVWLDDDFSASALNSNWTLYNGMVHDKQNKILTVDEPTGTVEAYYSMNGLPLGHDWAVRFKLRLDQGHQGRLDGIFADGSDRFYWSLYPDENRMGAQGPGSANNLVSTEGVWYEYLYWFHEVNGGKGISVYRRAEGVTAWTAIYGNYKYDAVNVNSAAPSLRFLCTNANTNFSLDDVQIYQGAYAKLDEPVINGTNVTINGVFDNSDPGMTEKRQVTLMAAIYDKEYGYTVDADSATVTVNNGVKATLNQSFSFPGLDTTKHDVVVMAWDAAENGLPLTGASGAVKEDTSEVNPEDGQAAGITPVVSYNEVALSGYVGQANGRITASLMKNGEVYAVIQETANKSGMISTKLGVDPGCASGDYTLRVQFGNTVATETPVTLTCNDAIPASGINSETDLKNFIDTYGDAATKALLQTDGILPYMYGQFSKIVTAAAYADIYAFRPVLEAAAEKGEAELDLVTKVNSAVTTKSWADIEELVTLTYRDLVGVSGDALHDIVSSKDLFLRMTGGYTWATDILADFNTAHAAQKAAEVSSGTIGGTVTGGITGGVTGGGGGAMGGSGGFAVEEGIIPDIETGSNANASVAFNDLDTVPWAQESIRALQLEGIISGDGNGGFAPDRAVSREEFLKLAMLAAGIGANENLAVNFADVDGNAWYAPYVAAAYEMGIVKGISETEFGIGQQITRADMAVMLKRILDTCGVEAVPLKAAFRFNDGLEIPDYAIDDVAALCEAELLNGMGDNNFKPMASATRAEAAVAIYRIYNYIGEGR